MRNNYKAVAIALVASMTLTGCSVDKVKEMFIGTQAAKSSTVSGGSVVVEEYRPEACVTLGEYKGIEVDCTVTDEDIQNEIDSLLDSKITYKEIKKGKAEVGMDLNIDYVGKMDGKKFDGGSAEDQMIELGNSGFIPGFDDGIVGMEVGEKKDIHVTFPDPYENNPDLAGKDAVFTITLNYIAKEQKPEFNDKFVSENTDYKTVDEYKENTRESLAQELKANASTTAFSKVLEASKPVNVPPTLVEAEKQQMDVYMRNQIKQYYNMELDDYIESYGSSMGMTKEAYEQQLQQSAEDNAFALLVIEAIAAKENISCTEAERKAYVQEMLTSSGMTEEQNREQYESMYGDVFAYDEFIRQVYLHEKVLEVIEKNAVIKE